MTASPAVTVVVPTHDRPVLMARAVQSAVSQRYDGHVEVVVVFDASEPHLPDVPESPGRTVRWVVNDRRRGLAGARNAGVLAASHDWVAFLDDDDVWHPTKLAAQVARSEEQPGALLVGTAMVVDDGTRLHQRLLPSEPVTHEQLLHDRLAGLHSSSFLVRRSALLGEVGLVDEDLPRSYGEDYDLLLRVASIAPIPVVNRPLVTVTWAGQSHFLGRWGTYADALEQLLDKHPGFAGSRRALGRVESQIAFARAAQGHRRSALRWTARALRHDPRRVRAWLAVAVAAGALDAELVVRAGRRLGRGL